MKLELYTYRARIMRVVDGDTLDVDIDLGLGVWLHRQRLRLYGVNTPEVRGPERPEGLKATAFVVDRVQEFGDWAYVRTYKDKTGKYGRWLAELLWYPVEGRVYNLNNMLKHKGWGTGR